MALMYMIIISLLFVGSVSAAENGLFAIPPDWRYSGGTEAPVQAEVTDLVYDGAKAQALKLTCLPLKADVTVREPGIVRQLIKLNLSEHKVLSFKAKFIATGEAKPLFTIRLLGKGVNLQKVFSPKEAEPVECADGFHAFKWDFGSQLKSGTNQLTEFVISGEYKTLPADGKLEVVIIDFVFERSTPIAEGPVALAPPEWIRAEPLSFHDVPLQGWTADVPEAVEGITIEKVSANYEGKEVSALRLTYRQNKKYSPVSLPFKINADEYNVFTLKAKVDAPAGSKRLGSIEAPLTGWDSGQFNAYFDNFGISMQESNAVPWTSQGVPSTHFLQHLDKSVPAKEGFQTFVWDMKNENRTGNKGFNLEEVASVKFFYDNKKIKPGEQVVITIIDPKFVKGMMRTGGDRDKYAAFRSHMDNYQPDYSDSSKYLGPPETGRLPEPLPLVKSGKPLGEIVGHSSVWTADGNGVNELYHWLYYLTGGVELPVADQASEQDNVKIFVGAKYAEKSFPEDMAFLKGSDGCAIRNKGKSIYIFGATPKGTLNGIYTFLEGNTDIIWPRPSEMFGAVYTENPELAIRWGDYRHRTPACNWGWMGKTSGPVFDYQIRNRCNYLGLRSDVSFKYWGLFMEEGGGHNLHSWIPWSLWKTHPEYWCLINGERQHPNGYKNQICLGNPKGREIFIDRWLQEVERSPQSKAANCLNIKAEDNWGSCECAECLRPIRLPDGTRLQKEDIAFRSTQFFMFLNEVANAAHNRGYPNLQIGTYVYFFTVPVPKIPVTSYLRPYFCDYVRKDYKVPIFAPVNDIWWRVLNEWTKVSDKVVIREYTGLDVFFRPLADVAAWDIRAELAAGALEFTSESIPTCSTESPKSDDQQMDVSFMEYWLIARLYWDPEADVEQLRKYIIRRTFREAAPDMEKFYGTIRQLYFKEKRTTEFEENQETLRLVIAKGKERELRGYLDDALHHVKHPLSRKMIGLISLRYDTWINQLKSEKPRH